MRGLCILAIVALGLVLPTWKPGEDPEPLEVVPSVDLARYAGLWYEVARLPNRFQQDCAGDVTATYTVEGERLRVVNRCRTPDGEVDRAEGVARVAGGAGAKLEVRFAPKWLSWLPPVWGDYWILEIAPDYDYSLVGTPDRRYLWILSRTPQMDRARYDRLVARAGALGFDTSRLVRTAPTDRVAS